MNNMNYYPQSQQSFPSIVYVPTGSSPKVNRSVSVIAIILIIALLFVGMKMINENGFYKEVKNIVWNRGYIDHQENGLGIPDGEFFGNWKFQKSYGMYTKDKISIKYGVKIERDFDSSLSYQVHLYDEFDVHLAVMGVPEAGALILDYGEQLTGELAKAKYVRLFAYPREVTLDENGMPSSRELNMWDWLANKKDIKIFVNESNMKDDWQNYFG